MQPKFVNENDRKIQSAKISLILFIALSVVNIFFIYFLERYFYFSSYFSTTLISYGTYLALETGIEELMFVFGTIAVLSLLPYILCFIFFKKHPAWAIVATVLASLDTLLLIMDIPLYLELGDFSIFPDLIFHAVIVIELAVGIKAVITKRKDDAAAAALAEEIASDITDTVTEDSEGAAETEVSEAEPVGTRTVTVTRKKAFSGCAVAMKIFVGDTLVLTLKNGNTGSFEAPASEFTINASVGLASGTQKIEAGGDISLEAAIKMGMVVNTVSFKYL